MVYDSELLLTVVDRSGIPEAADAVEAVLRQELSSTFRLSHPDELRNVLRRLRIRDLGTASPADLEELAAELEVERILSATVHEAVSGPVPEVTLSATSFRAGAHHLAWTGFEASSGLEGADWLAQGNTTDLNQLARAGAYQLARQATALGTAHVGWKPRLRPARHGFLARRPPVSELGTIAVVPFNSVSDIDPAIAAETVTRAALETLQRHGFDLVYPGLVSRIQRETGQLLRGQVDLRTREALRDEGGVSAILTGTVETYRLGGGLEPEPWIAISARLVDAADGRILWMNGLERRGFDGERLFKTGRVYSSGRLAQEIVDALIRSMLAP
jgi:TolB-like protein